MSHTLERLIRMANQIGRAFAHQPPDAAVEAIADHIKHFWEKRMLAQIFAHLDAGGAGLDERPKRSLERLKTNQALSNHTYTPAETGGASANMREKAE